MKLFPRQVGLVSMPKGGFGNRILNFLSVQNIALASNAFYFSKNTLDRGRVFGINRAPRIPLRLGNVSRFTRFDALAPDFLKRVNESLDARASVILKPRLLLDAYATFEGEGHNRTRIKMRACKTHQAVLEEKQLVTVHLRGGDFHAWNPRSVLTADYYLRAIDIAVEKFPGAKFLMATDDLSHPAFHSVESRLNSEKSLIVNQKCSTQMECDFVSMMHSQLIISSPSTFAISASILGSPAVIHNQSWAEYKADLGEVFWQKTLSKSMKSVDVLELI